MERKGKMLASSILLLVIFVLSMGVSCDIFPFDSYIAEENSNSIVDVPEGWEIERDGAYSSLGWNPDFKISKDGNEISFIDSSGEKIVMKSKGSTLIISKDNPKATFGNDKIVLELSGITLEFERKQ